MAELQMLRTPAERTLIEQFGRVADALPGGPAEVAARRAAFRRFEQAGLPHRRLEAWRYTDLRAALRSAPPPATGPVTAERAAAALAAGRSVFGPADAARLVFVDGAHVAALSASELPPGVSAELLAARLARGEALPDGLPRPFPDPMEAVNAAFVRDGALITVAPGARPALPLGLVHAATPGEARMALVRHVVRVGAGAEVTLFEEWLSPEGQACHSNAVIELTVEPGAVVRWVKAQVEGNEAVHLGTLSVDLEEGARLDHVILARGASLQRNQLFVRILGRGVALTTAGATLARRRQHLDSTLVVEHRAHGGTSRELYKAIVDERAESVFQGKIVVTREAQKTDARMASHAVLLSDEAEAVAKPELEIFADDVQCGHGATAGQLDERLRFYLQARGLPRAEAERLLIVAFLGEVLDQIADERLRDAALADVDSWLMERAP